MPIRVQCSNCRRRFRAPDTGLGKFGRCPNCGNRIKVQPVDEQEAVFTASAEESGDVVRQSSSDRPLFFVVAAVFIFGILSVVVLLIFAPSGPEQIVADTATDQPARSIARQPDPPETRLNAQASPLELISEPESVAIPPNESEKLEFSDLRYEVLVDVDIPPRRFRAAITLSRKLEENELESLAEHLRSSSGAHYYTAFSLLFILDKIPRDSVYWATVHWTNAERRINLMGITPSKEREMLASCRIDTTRELVGKWFDDHPAVETVYVLYRDDDESLTLFEMYNDGSNQESPVTSFEERESDDGVTAIFVADSPSFGPHDYAMIQSNGDLALYDNEGIVRVANAVP